VRTFCTAAIAVILISGSFFAYSQGNTSNSGTEFWTAYMDHISPPGGQNGSEMSLYITSSVNTSGTVSISDGSFSRPFTVLANQVTIFQIPASAFLGNVQGQSMKGIHITALKPVAVYGHIYASSVSGATLLLPVNTLGKDYYSINYTQQSNSAGSLSTFMVIGTEDNTTVQITPSVDLIGGQAAKATFTIHLKKGEVFQGLAQFDLTGTRIQSVSSASGGCTKIAVFSGSSKIYIGCPKITSDNLFQQVYPTASWGKSYITVPLANRSYDIFRIILSDPNTNVSLNGRNYITASPNNGLYYEFGSSDPNVIKADKPIQVAQYSVTQGNTQYCDASNNDLGDPEMIFLNPLEQTLDHVTLYSTSEYDIVANYINVVIKTAAVPTFVLDSKPYNTFTPVPGNPLYSYAKIPVVAGTHNISAADGFNAIAYGFGTYESYGYAAGTNLKDLTEFIALEDPVKNVTQTNGCTGIGYKLQLTLPFQTTDIVWDFKDGTTPYHDAKPVVKSTVIKDDKTLYIYEYYKISSYKAGDYSVVASVYNPIADVCGTTEQVETDFNISDPPTASFTLDATCLSDATLFTDQSDAKSSRIKTWLWDFGDGQTSALQNPTHEYQNPGDYDVVLTVANDNGCSDVSKAQKVHIVNRPVAAFEISAADCVSQAILFTDQSSASEGKIEQWIWNFGDGQDETRIDKKPFSHIYNQIGIYTVKLTVVLATGCKSLVYSKVITVNTLPIVDFALPDVCLSDTYAQFTDKSTGDDHTEAGFTYLWNFGDADANAANPNASALQNPRHKYSQAKNYEVSLTVTSKFGCAVTKAQTFTVNGDTPIANFIVENSSNLCSVNDVVFDDKSSVNFGNITKIKWYFDYNNLPTDTVVFLKDKMPADHKFSHSYALFNSPLTKTYLVRMDVYSGQTCVNTAQQSITVKANPAVTLTQIGPLCQGDLPVQIAENKNGFSGTGVFSGKGVSASGLFDPAAAGPGTFTISYKFTAQNGCDYSTTEQVTVNAVPLADAGKELVLLEGGQVMLKAAASGDNVTYKWTPSIGLDHDNVLNPIASPVSDVTYKLVVTNAQGCTAASEVTVKVLKYPVVPNAFTPNGDGINDTWDIKYLQTYPNNTVEVYNRYGERLYSSIGYAVPWDGT
jgi:PKD repeat protein